MSLEITFGTCGGDQLGDAWKDIVGTRKVRLVRYADSGFAEENIALLQFEDGTYEVGMGAALRPYTKIYEGRDWTQATAEFAWAMMRLAGDDEEPTDEELQEIEEDENRDQLNDVL